MTYQRPVGPPLNESSTRVGHDTFTDRPAAIEELMRITGIAPETATERAETAADICSLLGSLFKLPIPAGKGRA